MKIELLGALDYTKLEKELKNKEIQNYNEIINKIKELEKEGRVRKVSTAGRLSRFPGDVFEVLDLTDSKTFEQNTNFAKRVTSMGHDSITDHDYLVFAIKDVSPVVEQTIIAERFSSFTIKSRREVDFSNAGYYTPNFHDNSGNIISNNDEVIKEYQEYMESLFKEYSYLEENGISKEDARFVLPYCYNSNIIMGVDAHTLKDMIINFTKGHLSKIQELKEFGEILYEIAKENIPYLIDGIDKVAIDEIDYIKEYIDTYIKPQEYKVLEKPVLLNHPNDVDNTIIICTLMGKYQYTKEQAEKLVEKAEKENPKFKEELMRKIMFKGDRKELTQVNFEFQIPLSFAVLTHLTRHRTHHMLIPEFAPNVDLTQFKIPPKIKNSKLYDKYMQIFAKNVEVYNKFKSYGIRDEDLVYFTLSGNLVNVITNMDGRTLAHILELRECTKAQWETQAMARGMHAEINTLDNATIFSSLLGSTCMTQGICNEGKECCGKVYALKKNIVM